MPIASDILDRLRKSIAHAESAKAIGGYLQTIAKWEIREERHGNSNTPGDRA